MKKRFALLVVVVFLMTLTDCCKKNKNISTETTAMPAVEITVPTYDVIKEESDSLENMPEVTGQPAESALTKNNKFTVVPKPTETLPSTIEATKPTEAASSISQVLPGDNWETPDL